MDNYRGLQPRTKDHPFVARIKGACISYHVSKPITLHDLSFYAASMSWQDRARSIREFVTIKLVWDSLPLGMQKFLGPVTNDTVIENNKLLANLLRAYFGNGPTVNACKTMGDFRAMVADPTRVMALAIEMKVLPNLLTLKEYYVQFPGTESKIMLDEDFAKKTRTGPLMSESANFSVGFKSDANPFEVTPPNAAYLDDTMERLTALAATLRQNRNNG